MKKLCLLLLLAAIGNALPAQITNEPISEDIFNSTNPGRVRSRFTFLLAHNNRMIIDLYNAAYVSRLPDPDSLFKKIWSDLQPMWDSLSDPLKVRGVDYVSTINDVRIKINQYAPSASYYSYKDDELVQMKVDQDTLRFIGYVQRPGTYEVNSNNSRPGYIIMLLLNNISDVAKLPAGILSSGIVLLKKDILLSENKNAGGINRPFRSGTYDLQQQKRITGFSTNQPFAWPKHGVLPYGQMSIQYGRGEWMPSAGAGLEYFYGKTARGQYGVRLFWEPYFFFSRDQNKKLVTDRNDFVTIKYYSTWNYLDAGHTTTQYILNFSFGYLVGRKGEWFEPNTFKFSLPGFQRRNILAEPEFFFSKFFRRFSPSLKLSVFLE
jgi:hypothetical protein